VAEALFYHLEHRTMEDVLPGLLERTRERGLRALLRVGSAERMEALDAYLWTYSEQTFLAHGTAAEGHPSRQPIYLTTEQENPNKAEVLFLVGEAMPADWGAPSLAEFTRIVVLFEGRDPEALGGARAAWQNAKEAGHDVTYWKESPSGKWEKQT
jgi:DNA polymerase III subunit chi